MAHEPHPVPRWVVVGAGTGGTSATIGRYLRYRGHDTRLCVVDPERSAFFDGWVDQDPQRTVCGGSRIEGIGRPRVEPSFVGQVIDRMIKVPDAASIAAIRHVEPILGRRVGGSTGTNLWGSFQVIAEMLAAGEQGSVITLLCDGGERYGNTYYDDSWLVRNELDLVAHHRTLAEFFESGRWVS